MLLEDQDRSRWDSVEIGEGKELLEQALRRKRPGPYQIQAAIAALHATAAIGVETDWPQIAAFYGELSRMTGSPVVELNRAVAVAMAEGPEHGLEIVERIRKSGELDGYRLLHATRADLLRQLGRRDEAAGAYERALEQTSNRVEREFLERRLAEVRGVE